MKKICSLFLIFLLFSFKHPFYLSVTDLKYNLNTKVFEGSVKLFTNDFEKALKNELKQPIDLLHPKDREQTRKWIEQYINNHLVIKSQATKLSIKVLGFENEEEATWTYIESSECPSPKTLEVENTLLLDLLPEQSNIMQIEFKDNKQNYKLSKSEKTHVFVF